MQFKPGFNLILGDNGVGKTSVLEAATVAVSGFLTGMEDIPTRNIYKDDIHYNILVNNNGTFDRSYCYPVEIEVQFRMQELIIHGIELKLVLVP